MSILSLILLIWHLEGLIRKIWTFEFFSISSHSDWQFKDCIFRFSVLSLAWTICYPTSGLNYKLFKGYVLFFTKHADHSSVKIITNINHKMLVSFFWSIALQYWPFVANSKSAVNLLQSNLSLRVPEYYFVQNLETT